MTEPFIVTKASTWIARGRSPERAEAIAQAWRDFPDLPTSAPADERMKRTRLRVAAMRPVNDAIAERAAREREASNFAFVAGKIDRGEHNACDLAIMRGRVNYGYTWLAAVSYSRGWYAGHVGWEYNPRESQIAAYDQGFADGGGNPDDIFDAARRSLLAADRDEPTCLLARSPRGLSRRALRCRRGPFLIPRVHTARAARHGGG
jgi:hypothetical protein